MMFPGKFKPDLLLLLLRTIMLLDLLVLLS